MESARWLTFAPHASALAAEALSGTAKSAACVLKQGEIRQRADGETVVRAAFKEPGGRQPVGYHALADENDDPNGFGRTKARK